MEIYTINQLQGIIENEIALQITELENSDPHGLYEPIGYTLRMGGKRLRPLMVLIGYNLFSDRLEAALPAALGIEIFHNFTLLHDDIMDKAEMRRNMETVHIRFSQNKAILSGDAMSFLAYRHLLRHPGSAMVSVLDLFSQTALEVCEGQQLDMDFETRDDVTEPEYIRMIRLKTAVLLGCSLKTGSLVAGAGDEAADLLYDYGINLGLAFQLQDDLMDTYGEEKIFGKKIGNDIVSNKKTYLLIKALENAGSEQKRILGDWLGKTTFDPDEKVRVVKSIFDDLNIKKLTELKISEYFNVARLILEKSELTDIQKQQLEKLSSFMFRRNY